VQGIVDLCGKLVDQGRVTGEPRVDDGPACVYFIYDPNHMSQFAPLLETYLRSRSIAVAESAILARGHATVNKLRPAASRVPSNVSIALATAVFLWTSADVQAMDEALKCVGRFIADRFFPKKSADSRHHYCPETEESALKWRLFLARVLDACLHNTSVSNVQQTWGEWAKAVRANFEQIVVGAFQRSLPEDRERFTFTAPRAKSSTTVVESLDTTGAITKPEIRITTIHQAKGQTFDAVMLVSSRTRHGDGGHWRYWLDKTSGDGEHARFAYVASSRPRRLLVWAIPKGDESSAAELEDLGFVAQ
jgi:DNA helicase-2/ATP-dependent DNA helicase PcrA